MSTIVLRSLGDCAIDVSGYRIDPGKKIIFAALLRLVAEPSNVLPRSEIQTLLWPNIRDTKARQRLRQTLYTLKRAGVCLEPDDANIGITTSNVALDFRDAIACASRGIGPLLTSFLPGYAPSISDAFEGWLETFREQVHLQIRNALLGTIRIQRQNAAWFDLEITATRCLEIDPLNEEGTLALAEARAQVGNKVGAVRLLDTYQKELGAHAGRLRLPTALLRQRISDRLVRIEAPLIGREATIGEINAMIRHLGNGSGGGYLLTGPAGIGKTRVIDEIRRSTTLTDIAVVLTECLPSEAQSPLSVVTRLASTIRDLPGAAGCSPHSVGYLKRLIDEPLDAPVERNDAEMAALTYAALKRSIADLVDAVTHEVKLLILIDDIDQADPQSLEIITDLVSNNRSGSLLILMTARDSSAPVARLAASGRRLRSHALKPLDRQDASALLRRLTATHHGGLSEDQQALYVEMAAGNPMCIQELAWYWESTGHTHSIPPSIESALRERVIGLSQDELTTLRAIIVLGRHASLKRLSDLLEIAEAALLRIVEHLDRSGLVRWKADAVTCVHKVLADLACEDLSSTASISLHGKVAQLLGAELDPPDDYRLFWDCANHYRLAKLHRDAIALFSRCSDRLLKLGLPREAVSLWERAFDWCETDENRLLVQERLIPALRVAGEHGRVSRIANQVMQLRRTLQLGNSGWSDWQIDVLEARMYTLEDVEPILAEASACLADESTAPRTRARAGICAMICAYNLHDAVRLRHFHRILESLADEVGLSPADRLTASLIFHAYVGDLKAGAKAGSELVALARINGCAASIAQSLRRHALVLRMLGRFAAAHSELNEALEIVQWMDSRSYVLATLTLLGETFIEQGDLLSARNLLDRVITANDRRRFPYRAIDIAQLRAMIALMNGNKMEAIRICDSRAFRKWRAQSRRSSGRIKHETQALSILSTLVHEKTLRSKRQLAAFEERFIHLQGFGSQDFAAFALCKGLIALRQPDRARAILTDYILKHRRERYPAPEYLKALLGLASERTSPD